MVMLRNSFKESLLIFIDILIFIIALTITFWLRNSSEADFSFAVILSQMYIFYPVFIILLLSLFVAEMYDLPIVYSRIEIISRITYAQITTSILSFLVFYFFPNYFIGSPKTLILIFTFVNIFLLSLWRIYGNNLFQNHTRSRALLIGKGKEINEIYEQVNNHDLYPLYFVKYFSLVQDGVSQQKLFESEKVEEIIKSLQKFLTNNQIKHVVLDIRDPEVARLLPYIYNLTSQDIKFYDMAAIYQDVFRKIPLSAIGYFWFFEHVSLETRIFDFCQRMGDLILAIPTLIIFLICLPFVWLALKLENQGDNKIFSVQKRLGLGGKIINVYKFRTMLYTDFGKWREDLNNSNHPTKVGEILRRTNIDELPQVINILKGEMSFVGPRNDIVSLGEKLYSEIPYYMIRYSIQPGLTGWAQTLQKEIPHTLEHSINRFQYDLFYIKNRSLLIYLIIILRTIKALLNRIFQ